MKKYDILTLAVGLSLIILTIATFAVMKIQEIM